MTSNVWQTIGGLSSPRRWSLSGLGEKYHAFSYLLLVVDCIMPVLILPLLTWVYGVPWTRHYTHLAAYASALSFILFPMQGLYRSWRSARWWDEFLVVGKGWLTFIGVILCILFATKTSYRYSRVVVVAWFMVTPLLLFSLRRLGRMVLGVARAKGYNLKRAVIVGANDYGLRVAERIRRHPWAGIKILGFFDDDDHEFASRENGLASRYIGRIEDLSEYVRTHKVDYIYIALPLREEEKVKKVLAEYRTIGAEILFFPDIYSYQLFNARVVTVADLLALDFCPEPFLRRMFDVLFSLCALVVTAPLWGLIALGIVLEDGGPVFYRHRRITAAGKAFNCLKFRTMCVNADERLNELLARDPAARAEWEQTYKLKRDPRVTRIGWILRRTSLDELPQFLNVLKGDMTIVGARPIVDRELYEYYREHGGLYCSLKPGITGIWQVTKRSDTEDYSERVRLDVWYVLHRNFWLDVKIILRTIGCIFSGKGAY